MIKKLLLAIMIALPMSVFAQKFAVINTQQLMESMPEIKTVNEQLEAANKKYQDEFTKLQEEFQKKFEEFQGLEASTPQTIKDRRMQEMQELETRYSSSAKWPLRTSSVSSSSSWPPFRKRSSKPSRP